jgi:hypothetical protein
MELFPPRDRAPGDLIGCGGVGHTLCSFKAWRVRRRLFTGICADQLRPHA